MVMAFYFAGAVAVIATLLMLTGLNIVHSLLYFVVSLLAVAVVFYAIGAPFVAALEVIIYAGAIMVLFVFVVMMLNIGMQAISLEKAWLPPRIWFGPTLLAGALLSEVAYLVVPGGDTHIGEGMVDPKQVGIVLFGPYMIGVELASILLLAGLVGAYHIGCRITRSAESRNARNTHEGWATTRRGPVFPGTDRPARTP
jgi:NADH-quinone oxidoreductase subunit J